MTSTFPPIGTDYEPSIPRDRFLRKMRGLADQTCDDFEVIVSHDGPKTEPYAAEVAGQPLHPRTRFVVTEARANAWGPTNRDRGIRAAAGGWIIHTNADNVFDPTLVERLKAALTDGVPCFRRTHRAFAAIRAIPEISGEHC
jgi:glycosyltransferase involved in cell wall biosynthesis